MKISLRSLPLFMLATLLLLSAGRAQEMPGFDLDEYGRVHLLDVAGMRSGIFTDLRVFAPDWDPMLSLADAAELAVERTDAGTRCTGVFELNDGQRCRFTQQLQTEAGAVRLDVSVKAEEAVATEGVFFWIQMPVDELMGGTAVLTDSSGWPHHVTLPVEPPWESHILGKAETRKVVITSANEALEFRVDLGTDYEAQIQDDRRWNSKNYGLLVALKKGGIEAGETLTLNAQLALERQEDERPAVLEIDPRGTGATFAGCGGNYCFGIESPQTDHTLDTLRVAWARTQLTLDAWEPANDNDDPARVDWDAFLAQDRPGSAMRREFQFMQRLERLGIPFCVSVWYPPAWMCVDPDRPRNDFGRILAPGMDAEIAESVTAYLSYAKRRYRVEPELFSFNEPDGGVRILLTPEEHRDMIIRLGKRFEAAGLSTRLLLGDVMHVQDTVEYTQPTVASPEAMQYVGAVAFHTWNGGSPEHFRAWHDLARQIDKPLLVTEMGLDPLGWRTGSYKLPGYALQELQLYQDTLRYARPTAVMQYEYTNDYALVRGDTADDLVPTTRYFFIKHFSNLTPPDAEHLAVTCDHPRVRFSAFRGSVQGDTVFVLHVANLGAEREITVRGLPHGVGTLERTVTDLSVSYRRLADVAVRAGECRLTVNAHSLTTLRVRMTD